VLFDGVDVRDIRPADRGIGMVFQGYALYPFSSKRNVLSYFMFRKQTPQLDAIRAEKYRRTCELLGVDIEYLADRDTRHLSGGEKQRVALGRCITRDPQLFLLDEPFSSLDAKLREKYRFGLRKLLQELEITTVYVTHDQQEALILADLLAIMNVGTIEQVGTPEQVYGMPNSMFVADFLNISVDTPAINFVDGASVSSEWRGRTLGIRPEDVELGASAAPPAWPVMVTSVRATPMNRSVVLTARLHGQDVYLRLPPDRAIEVGREIWLNVQRLHVFDSQSGRRIDTVR
jgi:ABC-type sugar transport system ATPase subunit